jgi:hypothetical protein
MVEDTWSYFFSFFFSFFNQTENQFTSYPVLCFKLITNQGYFCSIIAGTTISQDKQLRNPPPKKEGPRDTKIDQD